MSRVLPGLSSTPVANAFAPLGGRGGAAGAAEALATGAARPAAAGDGVRHSRILTDALQRAAGGAPAQPLPVVTDALGVMRPGRFSA
ncbi:hypothetical protein J8J27_25805, partial [Mycobacterium tuberculosis]|nr:hypothetical protein [Mycobacterium tuberculosis]